MPTPHLSYDLEYFFIRIGKEYFRIKVCDIVYIESQRGYTKVVTDTTSHLVHIPLHLFTRELSTLHFCQVHRSFVVALKKVCSFNHNHIVVSGTKLPLGELYRKKLLKHPFVLHHPSYSQVASAIHSQ